MTTTGPCRFLKRLILVVILSSVATNFFIQSADAEDETQTSDSAACQSIINDVADAIQNYCEARNLNTVQYLEFLGSYGSLSQEAVEKQFLESLKERGIQLQKVDSMRLKGKLVSQKSGEKAVLLVQCTLTDTSGAELKTFRRRKVIEG